MWLVTVAVALWSEAVAAQVFPPDPDWFAVLDNLCSAPIFDAAGDTGTGTSRDLVRQDAPAVLAWADGQHLYLRLRVDGDPRAGTTWAQFGWGCQISADGNSDAFEWMVLLDGKTPQVAVYQNLVATGTPSDTAESLVSSQPTSGAASDCGSPSASANARDCEDGAGDYFVDFAAPLSSMLLSAQDEIQVVCGANSSAEPFLTIGVSGDIAGVGGTGAPIWNDIASCPFSVGCTGIATCPEGTSCLSSGPAAGLCGECEADSDCSDPEQPTCSPLGQCVAQPLFGDDFETGDLSRWSAQG
jgi:hypothetical protein